MHPNKFIGIIASVLCCGVVRSGGPAVTSEMYGGRGATVFNWNKATGEVGKLSHKKNMLKSNIQFTIFNKSFKESIKTKNLTVPGIS